MIRVTIDLVPLGIESASYNLETIEIINNGSGNKKKGSYNLRYKKQLYENAVVDFDREKGAAVLVLDALEWMEFNGLI